VYFVQVVTNVNKKNPKGYFTIVNYLKSKFFIDFFVYIKLFKELNFKILNYIV